MGKHLIAKISFCLFMLGVALYLYLEEQNHLIQLRMRLPEVTKQLRALKEENRRLQYAIEQYESPDHLIKLLKTSAFSQLKYPMVDEVLTVKNPYDLSREPSLSPKKSLPSLVIGQVP